MVQQEQKEKVNEQKGFVPANEISYPEWEKKDVRTYQNLLTAFDIVLEKIKPLDKEGYGNKIHIQLGEYSVLWEQIPTAPKSGGYPPKKPDAPKVQAASTLTAAQILAAVKAAGMNEADLEVTEHPQGGEFTIRGKKHLGDLWTQYNEALRKLGCEYIRKDNNNPTTTGLWRVKLGQ